MPGATLYLSGEAERTLRSCHAVHARRGSDGRAALRDAAAECQQYGLWDFSGLPPRDLAQLQARLRVLAADRTNARDSADAFVRRLQTGEAPRAAARQPTKRQLDQKDSWGFFRSALDKLGRLTVGGDVAPGTPRAPLPKVPRLIAAADEAARHAARLPAAELASVAPAADRARQTRGWEARREQKDKYYADRLEAKRRQVAEEEAAAAAAAFGPLAIADQAKRPLTAQQRRRAQQAMNAGDRTVLVDHGNCEVCGEHARRLAPTGWLVDELVNSYFVLLQERDAKLVQHDGRRSCHFFNSFFIPKLMGTDATQYNYAGVKRWTKRFDLFEKRMMFAPVNLGNMHWCLVSADFERKEIRYYDSMGAPGMAYLRALKRYLEDEHRQKKGAPLDAGWSLVPTTADTPRQMNGYDCGVFSTFCAHYASAGAALEFSQRDIPDFRLRMMTSILEKEILCELPGN